MTFNFFIFQIINIIFINIIIMRFRYIEKIRKFFNFKNYSYKIKNIYVLIIKEGSHPYNFLQIANNHDSIFH
jgi:hypothetical protein